MTLATCVTVSPAPNFQVRQIPAQPQTRQDRRRATVEAIEPTGITRLSGSRSVGGRDPEEISLLNG